MRRRRGEHSRASPANIPRGCRRVREPKQSLHCPFARRSTQLSLPETVPGFRFPSAAPTVRRRRLSGALLRRAARYRSTIHNERSLAHRRYRTREIESSRSTGTCVRPTSASELLGCRVPTTTRNTRVSLALHRSRGPADHRLGALRVSPSDALAHRRRILRSHTPEVVAATRGTHAERPRLRPCRVVRAARLAQVRCIGLEAHATGFAHRCPFNVQQFCIPGRQRRQGFARRCC